MDWFPLLNSVRIAGISTAAALFLGVLLAYAVAKLPRGVKGGLDVLLTLPLVLPPTVIGYLLLRVVGPKRALGAWLLRAFSLRLTMTWHAAVLATVVVIFPLMYRTARASFEAFDETLAHAGRTLGKSEGWIFFHVRLPVCKHGILAGVVLSFARALGEYGATSMLAGFTPGKTATISTTVYQLWRTNRDAEAFWWVLVNVGLSCMVLMLMNLMENKRRRREKPCA